MVRVLRWVLPIAFLLGCRGERTEFPYGKGYVFVDHRGDTVRLDDFKGRTLVVTYFYTHCPDACPLTTANLKRLYDRLPDSVRKKVLFLSFSIDPERDSPEVLREYAKRYGISTPGWLFLTGDPGNIPKFLKDVGVIAVKGKTEIAPNGDTVYFFTHTDYVHVVSPDGRIVYRGDGDRLNLEEIQRRIYSTLP